ncbi:PD-(D/E)XK nuclease family protein [Patescibacteria group bacterium]|nr:PD-(D/E)XK nuclease family protein [Patescibacteria group bacterium]MBU2259598.1 PD-(D/E)XK nuclease family protein [Patescibacteria group bacterium]
MPLSYSQLSTYRRCPRQYEYATIKKIPRSISEAESFGSSVHNALKKWGEIEKRKTENGKWKTAERQLGMFDGEKMDDDQLLTLDTLLSLWHQSFIVDTYSSRVEADFARKRGEQLMQEFFQWWSGEVREVVAVEKSFSLSFDGSVLKGRFDRVEAGGNHVRIIDFKTSSPRSQDEVDADLQLSIYALAVEEVFGKPCTELMFLFLSDEGVIERSTTRSESQLKDARKQIQVLEGRIEEKDFHPTPSAGVCRCCPYKGVCDVAAITSTPSPSSTGGGEHC